MQVKALWSLSATQSLTWGWRRLVLVGSAFSLTITHPISSYNFTHHPYTQPLNLTYIHPFIHPYTQSLNLTYIHPSIHLHINMHPSFQSRKLNILQQQTLSGALFMTSYHGVVFSAVNLHPKCSGKANFTATGACSKRNCLLFVRKYNFSHSPSIHPSFHSSKQSFHPSNEKEEEEEGK